MPATAAALRIAITQPSMNWSGDGNIQSVRQAISRAAAKATFFTRGGARPVVALQGRPCTAVICRAVEDPDLVCLQLQATAPELIFWPMTPNCPGLSHNTGKSGVITPAGEIAFALPRAKPGVTVFTLSQSS